jgi:hypothetical protein
MLIIAHRGLTQGPDPVLENDPEHITQLLQSGWHVEVDVRMEQGVWYLGHDSATHKIDRQFLLRPGLWIHAKDHAACGALHELRREYHYVNYFWHESDARVLTSQGHWWTQPGLPLVQNSVAVMPEWHVDDLKQCTEWPCVAICTDWGSQLQ